MPTGSGLGSAAAGAWRPGRTPHATTSTMIDATAARAPSDGRVCAIEIRRRPIGSTPNKSTNETQQKTETKTVEHETRPPDPQIQCVRRCC